MKLSTVFKKIGIGLSVVLTVLLIILLSIWVWPSLLINERNLVRLGSFLDDSFKVNWTTLRVDAFSESFSQKKIELEGKEICLSGSSYHSCFSDVQILLKFRMSWLTPKLHISVIKLTNGKIAVREVASAQPEEASAESTSLIPEPPAFLGMISVDTVFIEATEVSFDGLKNDFKGKAKILLEAKGKGLDANIVASGNLLPEKYNLRSEIKFQSLDSQFFGPFVINGQAAAELPTKEGISVLFKGVPQGAEKVKYSVQATYQKKQGNVKASIAGEAGLTHVKGTVNASIQKMITRMPDLNIKTCVFDWTRSNNQMKLNLNCPGESGGRFPTFKGGPVQKILNQIRFILKADVTLKEGAEDQGALKGTIELLSDPSWNAIHHGEGSILTEISGRIDDFPKNISFNTNVGLKIPSFQKVVQMMKQYPWAVPSPFNSLDGTIDLKVSGKGSLEQGAELPIDFQTKLNSSNQDLNIDGNGKLNINFEGENEPKAHLDFKVILSSIKLMLPTLSKEAPPRLVPDSRIKGRGPSSVVKKEVSNFTFNIEIETPQDRPVQLVSNLAEDKIPIGLALKITDKGGARGTIGIKSFPLNLFRRNAKLHHLTIKLNNDSNKSEVDGEIRVVYTDYTIRILILGLLSEPQIKFLSDPPLPEDKVIAVLLFGKEIEALDESEASSVGSTRAAVEDSAISLASMYVLASTPVESVGYDRASRVFKAKVRLSDGTSLTVGTNMKELSQIGIRKRLGRHWAIITSLENPQEQLVNQSVSALLEWTKGY